jgi:hypothetical protein
MGYGKLVEYLVATFYFIILQPLKSAPVHKVFIDKHFNERSAD